MRTYTSIKAEAGERQFRCGRCGHEAIAQVVGVGEGISSDLNVEAHDTARSRARVDALRDIDRTIQAARCPQCKARSGAGRWWLGQLGPMIAIMSLIIGVCWLPTILSDNPGDQEQAAIAGWVMTGIIAVMAIPLFTLTLLSKWRSVDSRVAWKKPS